MATYSKLLLSGSISGQPIPINAISSSTANPLHTSIVGSSSFDEIYIYATNTSVFSIPLTICWGGTGSLNQLPITIGALLGRVCICDGMLLNGGLTAYAYASVSGSILIDGFVNRIQ
jgi:hypothetical protein